MSTIVTKQPNAQFASIPEHRMLKTQPLQHQPNQGARIRVNKENRPSVKDKTLESWPGNSSDRRRLYESMKETKGVLKETAYNDYKQKGEDNSNEKSKSKKGQPSSNTIVAAYEDKPVRPMPGKKEPGTTMPHTGKDTRAGDLERAKRKGNKRGGTPEVEHLPEIATESPRREFYPKGFIPAAYTIHRPVVQAKPPSDDDLSTMTKKNIIDRHRQLIYKETTLTKAKVEKLKAHGSLDNDVYLKLKKSKEERRWDILHKSIHDQPKTVHALWEFFRVEYKDVHRLLQDEYIAAIRLHFQPRLSNLKSTPGNLLKMSDILLEITEEYDVRVHELAKALSEKDRQLDAAKKLLHKTKTMVFSWGQRELGEPSEDLRQVAQEIYDVTAEIANEKDNEILQQTEANDELKKKVSRLNKTLKEKDKKLQDLINKQEVEVISNHTGSQKGSQLSLNRRPESNQNGE